MIIYGVMDPESRGYAVIDTILPIISLLSDFIKKLDWNFGWTGLYFKKFLRLTVKDRKRLDIIYYER